MKARSNVWQLGSGQALVEALLGLGVLAVLFWAISVLGRQLDLVQQLAHASRHAVFLEAAGQWDQALEQNLLDDFWLAGHERRWKTPQRQPLLVPGSAHWETGRSQLPEAAELGGTQRDAARLRPEWALHDPGIYQRSAVVRLQGFRVWVPGDHHSSADAAPGMMPELVFKRHTSLVAGAGATAGDDGTSDRLEQGASAWAAAADHSRQLGRHVTGLLSPLERGWGRAQPRWDWVRSWQHERPTLAPQDVGGESGW